MDSKRSMSIFWEIRRVDVGVWKVCKLVFVRVGG